MAYGVWSEELEFDGVRFRAEAVEEHHAKRAGFSRIVAVDGLPLSFVDSVVRAAQVSETPHTWRVRRVGSEAEVDEDLLTRGRQALDIDIKNLGVHIITYLGESADRQGELHFLAAGAIRNKLTREFERNDYPVVSRAVVSERHRGKGLGSLIVEHRMKLVLSYFGKTPRAIHFGTENEKILHAVNKVEQSEGITFVHIGDEHYQLPDGSVHKVKDYLCYLPWFQSELLKACDTLKSVSGDGDVVQRLRDGVQLFITQGMAGITGARLGDLIAEVSAALAPVELTEDQKAAFGLIEEILIIRGIIGSSDPS